MYSAVESYKTNDWDQFITDVGTHFSDNMILGGRATQQIGYDYSSASTMSSLGIDLNLVAKANFSKLLADPSYDWHKY